MVDWRWTPGWVSYWGGGGPAGGGAKAGGLCGGGGIEVVVFVRWTPGVGAPEKVDVLDGGPGM